ncbi:MAG: hypothetical protein FWH31_10875 [Streptococcaceae bacterium]|nr:hypothetical protein [Streptococcaceae bacterium]
MRNIFITRNRDNDNISVYEKEPAVVITADRSDLSYLKNLSYANNPGIYLLLGENKRYVGQAAGQTINQRLSQHNLDENKSWFSKIIFFGRIDGNLTRTQADILEAKLIAYFEENEIPTENKTVGNSGKVDRLSEYQANELWDTFFEVLEEVANIDLIQQEIQEETAKPQNKDFVVKYDGKAIRNKVARQLYIRLVKELWKSELYNEKLREFVVDEKATYKYVFGRKANVASNGAKDSVEIDDGIHLYVSLSRASISWEINKIANWLGIKIETNF